MENKFLYNLHNLLTIFIAAVWLVNGLFCKVLNLVPRHQQIVGEILGEEHASILTLLIGISEIIMAIWILSRYRAKVNAILQIAIIATMNLLELLLVPKLLLWGSMNFLFAMVFILVIWYNNFKLGKESPSNSFI